MPTVALSDDIVSTNGLPIGCGSNTMRTVPENPALRPTPAPPGSGGSAHRVGRFLLWLTTGVSPSLRIAHADEPT